MKNPFSKSSRLQPQVEAFREKFRRTLVGWWGTLETTPMGFRYHFHNDGTGFFVEYSGFSDDKISFEWRSIGDWVIEIKFDYANHPIEIEEDSADEDIPIDTVEGEESAWERIAYDFVAADVGYHWDIVLCNALQAARLRENPKDHDMLIRGLQGWDGPLVRLQD